MNRFAPVLRDLSDRLSLPQAARSRILLEISADLDDLFRAYRDEGRSEEDAEEAALGQIDLSDEALDALCRIHGGWLRRVVDTLAHRSGPTWERVVLVVLALAAVGLGGGFVQAAPMSRAAGLPVLPVAFLALAGLVTAGWKAWGIFVLGDHRPRRLRAGLDGVLELSVTQMFVAFGGLWLTAVATYRAAAGETPRAVALMTMHWLQSSLALLVVSLTLAIVVALLWFFLLMHVVSIEHREAAALLEEWGADDQPR